MPACQTGIEPVNTVDGRDVRAEMRHFVVELSAYAKSLNPDFLIIPQNGQELVTDTGEASGVPQTDYLSAIDATGRENLFYGYHHDNRETPAEETRHMVDLCLLCETYGVEVLTTDYCSSPGKMDHSYMVNQDYGFISFAADERELTNIPSYPAQPYHENAEDVVHISEAKNFLYLINTEDFASRQAFVDAVSRTNYDLIIMDLFHEGQAYTSAELSKLKTKHNGGRRLVVAYVSIGQAEDYRFYWQANWRAGNPVWLDHEDPDWRGNFYVRYWESAWQNIIYGSVDAYIDRTMAAGFDGVYLDRVDAFEFFEEQ
ncbi:MAG: endo alpha-1,4 polygalactosaminidase [Anaerolineae bacterium]|nr:endo alpha-1,4 polygalactosaminidase [Anaerolineae bacterium]